MSEERQGPVFATFVARVEVIDPHTRRRVEVAIYKLGPDGEMFGVDGDYLESVFDGDPLYYPYDDWQRPIAVPVGSIAQNTGPVYRAYPAEEDIVSDKDNPADWLVSTLNRRTGSRLNFWAWASLFFLAVFVVCVVVHQIGLALARK